MPDIEFDAANGTVNKTGRDRYTTAKQVNT
jgi:hypothetical protein